MTLSCFIKDVNSKYSAPQYGYWVSVKLHIYNNILSIFCIHIRCLFICPKVLFSLLFACFPFIVTLAILKKTGNLYKLKSINYKFKYLFVIK